MEVHYATANSSDKAQRGCKYIAEIYVQSFFPELEGAKWASKVAEIEQRLAGTGSRQADHRTFTHGVYGNEDFFNQITNQLRQLLADVWEKALGRNGLDLTVDRTVQAFWEKVVIFISLTRAIIATVTESVHSWDFGVPVENENIWKSSMPPEPFNHVFSKSQVCFTKWLAFDQLLGSFNSNGEGDEDDEDDKSVFSSFGAKICRTGKVYHSLRNMIFAGRVLFKECVGAAKRLKENHNNPEILAAFTRAMKKFMYTWAQSSTCSRGQAAMLAWLVDSMAKYAGCRFIRPEVPQAAKEMLQALTEELPDPKKMAGTETATGYSVLVEGNKFLRRYDGIWLDDLYYHYDVFALLMPNFARFDEVYPCQFVPIAANESP